MSADERGQQVGSAAQEAARLAAALHEWWAGRPEAPDGSRAQPNDSAQANDSAQRKPCRHCPICRAMALAQQVRPEVVDHLVDAAESFAAALRELARTVPDGAGSPESTHHDSTARTVNIHVEDDEPGTQARKGC